MLNFRLPFGSQNALGAKIENYKRVGIFLLFILLYPRNNADKNLKLPPNIVAAESYSLHY